MATKTTGFGSIAKFNRALSHIPKECTVALTEASGRIASVVAADAAALARNVGGVARLVAPTIRASKGRTPAITMGGTRQIPRHRRSAPRGLKVNVDAGALNLTNQTIGNVMWGAEFGASNYRQFNPWRGNKGRAGYFLWPAVRDDARYIMDTYADALDDALKAI